MSDEAFRIMRGLDMRFLETQVALQCAPLLAGVKLSNLLNVGADKRSAVMALFALTPVSCHVLYELDGRISVLLYREAEMEAHIKKDGVRELLEEWGYGGMELPEILRQVSGRYQKHMEGRGGFPHEIGLLLEYPEEDVKSFIRNEGRDFLYSGYWKVYGDLPKALETFAGYDRAREAVIRLAGSGNGIREILTSFTRQGCRAITI